MPVLFKIPEDSIIPLPRYLKDNRDRIENFGLFFQKFSRYSDDFKSAKNWNNGKRGRERRDYEWNLTKEQKEHYDNYVTNGFVISESLTKKHLSQKSFIKTNNMTILDLSAKLSSRLITGIGEVSPSEVGMVFDHNLGIPYIPATSVKGAVRMAYVANFVRDNNVENDKIEQADVLGLKEVFGSLDSKDSSRGGFVFMDSYSETTPVIVEDIMTPHFSNYYQGNSAPTETDSPNPIKFLAVEKGIKFLFRGFFITKEAESYRKELINAFKTALIEFGIGAKTAVGYGRFESFNDNSQKILEEIAKEKERIRVWKEKKCCRRKLKN